MRLDQWFDEMLGCFELLLADLRRGERVLIRPVGRLQGCRLDERGLGVVQQIHPEAHATEAQKNLRVLWIDLLRAHPVRERSLELSTMFRHGRGLAQRWNRIRFQRERGVIVLQRAGGIVVQEIRAGEIERQLVRRRTTVARAFEELDGRRCVALSRQPHADLDHQVARHLGGIECQRAFQERERERRLSLKRVNLCEAEMGTDEAIVELNRFLERYDAVVEALALEADRAEHRIGGGPCSWIAERPPRLGLRLVQPSLLDEMRRTLKGLGTVRPRWRALAGGGRNGLWRCNEQCAQDQRNGSRGSAPPHAWRRRSQNPWA